MSPSGQLTIAGRLVEASNGTFLALDEEQAAWVYKPVVGERPLWDYPESTLSRREVAAFELSQWLGIGLVPETVWVDGPVGEGSAQRWVEGEATDLIDLLPAEQVAEGWMPIVGGVDEDERPVLLVHRDDERLRAFALFDALLNNSDRKASHLIADGERLYGVDHGVSMSIEPKLRTVLWGWAGDQLTDAELKLVGEVAALVNPISPGLDDEEWVALVLRAEELLETGAFPRPQGGWPSIPWPPL